jgi:lipid-binding SYLF domain-containing protein
MRSASGEQGRSGFRVLVVLALIAAACVGGPRPASADDAQDARQLVEKARMTFEAFLADTDVGPALKELLPKARGILIYPQVLRAAFFVGASGGSGVFLVHDPKLDSWSGPAFYTIGQASFGIQAGGDASEIVLVALSDRGVSALLTTSTKLGATVGVTAGPIGAAAAAATANLSADILSYSRAMGLYAGISVEGAVVATRDALNKAYYAADITPTGILMHRSASNPHAAGLIKAVGDATKR